MVCNKESPCSCSAKPYSFSFSPEYSFALIVRLNGCGRRRVEI
jgi:hypothetical protein